MMWESPESDVTSSFNYEDTELTLGLPGEGRSRSITAGITYAKRVPIDTVDLKLGSSTSEPCDNTSVTDSHDDTGKAPVLKGREVGWPPVRSYRKKVIEGRKYVKVAVDGAPYLRKVDLHLYASYQSLLTALHQLFTPCFADGGGKGVEYMLTYEDKDGDCMLVGDVPWNIFMESCQRIRLMKSSDPMGLGPTSSANGSITIS